jgi:hypothetical protein
MWGRIFDDVIHRRRGRLEFEIDSAVKPASGAIIILYSMPNPNPNPYPIPSVPKFHEGRLSLNRLPVLRSDERENVSSKRLVILCIRMASPT